MKNYKIIIRRDRIGVYTDYLTDIVTAETIRRALEKAEQKILNPLRYAAQGKQTIYTITAIQLIERGKPNANDNSTINDVR